MSTRSPTLADDDASPRDGECDVFISYSRVDRETADNLLAALSARGIRCWIDRRDIDSGWDWRDAIMQAIESCRVMILVLSPHSNKSGQVEREVKYACDLDTVHLIPFRLGPVVPSRRLNWYIGKFNFFDAAETPQAADFQRLADDVERLVAETRGQNQDVAPPQVALLAPLAAAQFAPGELLSCQWRATADLETRLERVTVEIVAADGTATSLLGQGAYLAGVTTRYDWSIPRDFSAGEYRLRVTAWDAWGRHGAGESAAPLTIGVREPAAPPAEIPAPAPPPTPAVSPAVTPPTGAVTTTTAPVSSAVDSGLKLTSPALSELWEAGSWYSVRWTGGLPPQAATLAVDLIRDGVLPISLVTLVGPQLAEATAAGGEAGHGRTFLTLPKTLAAGRAQVRLTAKSAAGDSIAEAATPITILPERKPYLPPTSEAVFTGMGATGGLGGLGLAAVAVVSQGGHILYHTNWRETPIWQVCDQIKEGTSPVLGANWTYILVAALLAAAWGAAAGWAESLGSKRGAIVAYCAAWGCICGLGINLLFSAGPNPSLGPDPDSVGAAVVAPALDAEPVAPKFSLARAALLFAGLGLLYGDEPAADPAAPAGESLSKRLLDRLQNEGVRSSPPTESPLVTPTPSPFANGAGTPGESAWKPPASLFDDKSPFGKSLLEPNKDFTPFIDLSGPDDPNWYLRPVEGGYVSIFCGLLAGLIIGCIAAFSDI